MFSTTAPLAERLRPRTLADYVGQDKLVGPNGPLRRAIESNTVPSMILWGPPGVGKTTLALLIAEATKRPFHSLSAISSGVKDLREILSKPMGIFSPILFIDEIDSLVPARGSGQSEPQVTGRVVNTILAEMDGLDTVPDALEPPVGVVFWSFRIMVGIGVLMAAVGLWSLVSRLRGRLHDDRWLHRVALVMGPSGLIAVTAGWITTEVGRQPFVIYGELLTADAVAPVAASAVGASLLAFVAVYFVVFGAGVVYLLHLMGKVPLLGETGVESEAGPIRTAGMTSAPVGTREAAEEA